MAIGWRAIGSTATGGGALAFPMPSGVQVGDLLVLSYVEDANSYPATPSGWTLVDQAYAGLSGGSFAAPRAGVLTRIADGTEGTSVTVSFPAPPPAWPAADASVLGCITAYSGADRTAPIEAYAVTTAGGTAPNPAAAAVACPATTTHVNGDWLISIRMDCEGTGLTCSDSVGTDAERLDTTYLEMSLHYYDSNTALSAGAQTVRTLTDSAQASGGSVLFSLAVKPASSSSAAVASPQTAQAFGSAGSAAPSTTIGAWNTVCSADSMPQYTWAVDWALDGMAAAGTILNAYPYTTGFDTSGWTGNNAVIAFQPQKQPVGSLKLNCLQITPNGTSSAGGVNAASPSAVGSIVAGQQYLAQCWVYSPIAWTDMRACIDWYNASGGFISSGLGSATSVAPGWTQLSQSLTAPAGAACGVARARAGATPPSSLVWYAWGILLLDPSGTDERITPDASAVIMGDLLDPGVTYSYGRDQMRQLSPAALGQGAVTLDNSRRTYSPENTGSPLAGTTDAARPVRGQVVYNGTAYSLWSGRINGYTVNVARDNRTAALTFQDASSVMQNSKISTQLYQGIRTGDAIGVILDTAGWTGPRDLDPGGTVIPFWWLSQQAALDAVNDLVLSEGAPAIAYCAPDGTFTFRDRHHRLLREQSLVEQAQFAAQEIDSCTEPAVAEGLSFTEPFTYDHGWQDIVNSVSFNVDQREIDAQPSAVWTYSTATFTLGIGQTVSIQVVTSDPFLYAIPPVAGTDFTVSGAGTVTATLSQTSGSVATITLMATLGTVVVSGLQLRAYNIPVARTVVVSQQDTTSIGQHGEQDYGQGAPWADQYDAAAIASVVLLRYAQRRPTVELSVANSDPAHYAQILQRTISDLVHIQHNEMLLDNDFYVESVAHTVQRMNPAGQPPVHSVVLGCEAQVTQATNLFTFDQRGLGFDSGVFSPTVGDNPNTVFIFDDPVQGQFDNNLLAT